MSENQHEEEPGRGRREAEPVDDHPEERPKRPVRRGGVIAVAGAFLLVGAVVAGAGYTVVTVRDADRDPGAPAWSLPRTGAAQPKPAARTGLAGMLVPYGSGWDRGPDLEDFGSEAELSGKRTVALAMEALRDLPRSTRKRMEEELDKQHIEGMAMRSYVKQAGRAFYTDKAITVTVVLTQMDRAAARDMATYQNEVRSTLGGLREGPAIKGHKNAKCFLLPKPEKKDFGTMSCSASEGNVVVSLSASGPGDLGANKGAADLLATQLDRIKEPGVAV
ncbi:hypothetical protein ACIOC2_32950 [Streptomyces sp. NPDC088337]|uniref:hypothetical protein n=1 Tax=unclassified Streptomyces TaxID=2593676 RepID=UPI002DD7A522|nr:hypothetical protein [Streptomyces sp. NBC_01788]WSB27477.1 hypothetical protein OIE49_17110 [Streptomyces sp. NBC_01788]